MIYYFALFFIVISFFFAERTIVFYNNPSLINVKRIRFTFIFCSLLLMFVFTSVRVDVGWDYQVYYRTIINFEDTNIVQRGELLTILLVDLARYFDSAFLYFSLNALIFYVFLFLGLIRFNLNSYLPILLFLAFPLFFINSLSVVRTFTAIALVFYAISFLAERRYIAYALLVYLASCFHASALIAIVFPFFCYLKLSSKSYFIIFIVCYVGKNFLEYLVFFSNPVLANYLKPTLIQEGTKAIYFYAFIMIVLLALRERFLTSSTFYSSEMSLVIFNIFFSGFMIYFIFIEYGTLGHRLSLYGTILTLVIVPKLFFLIQPRSYSLAICFVFCLALLLMYYLTIIVAGESIVPYRTIFV